MRSHHKPFPRERVVGDKKIQSKPPKTKNPYIIPLLDNDLIRPAPFTHITYSVFHPGCYGFLSYEPLFDFNPKQPYSSNEDYFDVPVIQIAGAISPINHITSGHTFREALFWDLHGQGLNEASLEFFLSDTCKDDPPPQDTAEAGSARAAGALELVKFDDWYFVKNGKQRIVFMMYHIWQNYGDEGLIKNVKVEVRTPATK